MPSTVFIIESKKLQIVTEYMIIRGMYMKKFEYNFWKRINHLMYSVHLFLKQFACESESIQRMYGMLNLYCGSRTGKFESVSTKAGHRMG
jgi:hypothetical protein